MSNFTAQDFEENFADAWAPAPGDIIQGTLVELDSRDGGYGPYPILTLQTEDGERVAVHAFHTVLKNEVQSRNPQVGEEVGVKYFGKQKTKDGKGEFHSYRIKVRQGSAFEQAKVERTVEPTLAPTPEPDDEDIPF